MKTGFSDVAECPTFEWMRTARITNQVMCPTAKYEADCYRLFYLRNQYKLSAVCMLYASLRLGINWQKVDILGGQTCF